MTAKLECRDVRFAYRRGTPVLDGVSLALGEGTFSGIVGPNGSGKSTLLRVLAGLLKPQGGQVALERRSLGAMTRHAVARRIAFLPQMVSAAFSFTVREVVALGRYPHLGAFGFLTSRDLEVVESAIAETDSRELADRPFSELSGGERQRVLLASVIAQEPDVMLLDEPTSALDIHHQVAILGLLVRLARRGITVVAVTHDLNLASQFCERIALLNRGRVVREGGCEEVIDEKLLGEVYRTGVVVERNPVTGKPLVVLPGSLHEEDRGEDA